MEPPAENSNPPPDAKPFPLRSNRPFQHRTRPPSRQKISPLSREYRLRQLILDYAIGVSILGLIPIPGILAVKFILAGLLILKMLRDIGKAWGFPQGQDAFAIAGNLFGAIGGLTMALLAWATLFAIGVVVPVVRGLGIAAALFTLTWALGQATYQYYASSPEADDEPPNDPA